MHPYRTRAAGGAERYRSDDVRWRLRVTRGATALLALLVVRFVVLTLQSWREDSPSRYADELTLEATLDALRTRAVILLTFGVAIAIATFLFSSPRRSDGATAFLAGRLLRFLATAEVLVGAAECYSPVWILGPDAMLRSTVHILLIGIPSVGMWFVGTRLDDFWMPSAARRARFIAIGLGASNSVLVAGISEAGTVTVLLLLLGFAEVIRLRRAVRITSHEWWLNDEEVRTWASLIETGLGRADVLLCDGDVVSFANRDEGARWLKKRGFVRGEVALEERRVLDLPPSPLA